MLARIRFYHAQCVALALAAIGAGVAADMAMPHLAEALSLLTGLIFVALCTLVFE